MLLHEAPLVLLIINDARQVVYVNRDLLAAPDGKLNHDKLGVRPGECLECVHALEGIYGCGSTSYCTVCGLANTIRLGETGLTGRGECTLLLKNGESLTLKVYTKPFEYHKESYIFVALQDISDLKARLLLENIFLHDLKNTSAILSGLNELIEDLEPHVIRKILKEVAVRIDEEVEAYRLITSAESHQITARASTFNLAELVGEVIVSLRYNEVFKQKNIVDQSVNQLLKTDRTLLRQVIMNMLKNALEAGRAEDTVWVGHFKNNETRNITVFVKNNQAMPEMVKLQVFQKSFSTKGKGRGWGTYGIKLLTEKFLGGKASFVSESETGTIFKIEIPENLHPA